MLTGKDCIKWVLFSEKGVANYTHPTIFLLNHISPKQRPKKKNLRTNIKQKPNFL